MEKQSNRNKKAIEIHTNIHFELKADSNGMKEKLYEIINDSAVTNDIRNVIEFIRVEGWVLSSPPCTLYLHKFYFCFSLSPLLSQFVGRFSSRSSGTEHSTQKTSCHHQPNCCVLFGKFVLDYNTLRGRKLLPAACCRCNIERTIIM